MQDGQKVAGADVLEGLQHGVCGRVARQQKGGGGVHEPQNKWVGDRKHETGQGVVGNNVVRVLDVARGRGPLYVGARASAA